MEPKTAVPVADRRKSSSPLLNTIPHGDREGEFLPAVHELVPTDAPSTVIVDLEDSIDHCVALTRREGKTFYYTFITLPQAMFRDMCVLYAFMRITDDWADDDSLPIEARDSALSRWRHDLQESLSGRPQGHVIFPALADLVSRHHIPQRLLSAVIDGVRSDLAPRQCENFQELQHYCYQVAGAVGLCCLRIWGCRDEAAAPLAIDCGTAFQLTNIMRDLAEDAAVGRIYLPADEMARFGYSADDLRAGVRNENFTSLMRFQAERAHMYYEKAGDLAAYLQGPSRRVFRAMVSMYNTYLAEIERRKYDVFSRRVKLSTFRKLSVAFGAMLGAGAGHSVRRFRADPPSAGS